MKYFIAEESSQKDADSKVSLVARKEVTAEEVKETLAVFDFLQYIRPVVNLYNLVIRNGQDFLGYVNDKNLRRLIFDEHCESGDIANEANRLIFNYCSSFGTFLDYLNKSVKKSGKKAEFIEYKIKIEENDSAHRMLCILRNYCVHFSLPYSDVVAEVPDKIDLICKKKHLLEYNEWGDVKNYLKSLPDHVDLKPIVNKSMVTITALEMMLHYYFADYYSTAGKYMAEFSKNHSVSMPVAFIIIDDDGNMSMNPLPINHLAEGIQKLRENPNVTIKSEI